MSFRQVIVRKAEKIRLHNDNIRIEKLNKEAIEIPLEDIYIILIENPRILVTVKLLIRCAEFKVQVVFCNEKHDPAVLTQGFITSHK